MNGAGVQVHNNWQPRSAEVARLLDRVKAGELALATRISTVEDRLEAEWTAERASHTERRTRVWQVTLAIVTGLVLPLGVLGVLSLIHLVAR